MSGALVRCSDGRLKRCADGRLKRCVDEYCCDDGGPPLPNQLVATFSGVSICQSCIAFAPFYTGARRFTSGVTLNVSWGLTRFGDSCLWSVTNMGPVTLRQYSLGTPFCSVEVAQTTINMECHLARGGGWWAPSEGWSLYFGWPQHGYTALGDRFVGNIASRDGLCADLYNGGMWFNNPHSQCSWSDEYGDHFTMFYGGGVLVTLPP